MTRKWVRDEVKSHFKAIFLEMRALKTNLVRDAEGGVWAFGRWYGGKPHFRRNLGHWSEDVLREEYFSRLLPLEVEPLPESSSHDEQAWVELYLGLDLEQRQSQGEGEE